MAAIGAIATMLESGDHVVVTDNTYGGTFRLFDKVLTKYQLSFSYVDTSRLEEVVAAIRPETRMLFVETPSNPVMRITDLAAPRAALARSLRLWGQTSQARACSVRSSSARTLSPQTTST